MTMAAGLFDMVDGEGRTVRIRHAVVEDAAAILLHLTAAGAETDFLTFGAEGPGFTLADEQESLRLAAASDNRFWILAERDGLVVGNLTFFGGTRPRLRHVGEFGISVLREAWGLGLGRRMLEMLIDWARRGGIIRKINLGVAPSNARAIALYESLGFVVEGRVSRTVLVNGLLDDTVLMGLPIDPA
jgi:RimJ/RimL family protein N-acetyltransferase